MVMAQKSASVKRRAGCSRLTRCCWLLWLALTCGPPLLLAMAHAADASLEYNVKAGYLYNFAKFVEWPDRSFATPDSPMIVGVLGGTEALPVVEQAFQGRSLNGRSFQVKALSAGNAGRDCHIIFVTRAAQQSPEELCAALKGAPALLVGESDRFAEKGGSIGFVREDERIHFKLNLEATAQAGLKVSAKLAGVARLVKTSR